MNFALSCLNSSRRSNQHVDVLEAGENLASLRVKLTLADQDNEISRKSLGVDTLELFNLGDEGLHLTENLGSVQFFVVITVLAVFTAVSATEALALEKLLDTVLEVNLSRVANESDLALGVNEDNMRDTLHTVIVVGRRASSVVVLDLGPALGLDVLNHSFS